MDGLSIGVDEWTPADNPGTYDAVIAAVGYEHRASFIASTVRPVGRLQFAAAFPNQKEFAYSANYDWMASNGFAVEELADGDFASWAEQCVRKVLKLSRPGVRSFCIDVSSFSRYRIAVLVEAIFSAARVTPVEVHFLYALAKYSPPPTGEIANRHVGPVTPAFAGWFVEPDLPTTAILGLGYERDKALGAVEHVQPSQVWTFSPSSGIVKYQRALEQANDALLKTIPASNRFEYRVQHPYETFVTLESLVYRASGQGNAILFPFGPKIFAVCSLLVAALFPAVAVWRVSAGASEEPMDRFANGEVCGLSVSVSVSPAINDFSVTSGAESTGAAGVLVGYEATTFAGD